MIATTARRDPICFLLLYRIAETDRRPNLMLACLGAVLVLGCCLDGVIS